MPDEEETRFTTCHIATDCIAFDILRWPHSLAGFTATDRHRQPEISVAAFAHSDRANVSLWSLGIQ